MPSPLSPIGYAFRDPALLTRALTHRSFLPEHPEAGEANEKLEFLGDAVLMFILTEALFALFPHEQEGGLSVRRAALAKGAFLAGLARELGLPAALRLSRQEESSGGREKASVLEDTCEALVGAIFLDSDLATTRRVVLGWYGDLASRLATAVASGENPKGRLQELIHPRHGNDALAYEVVSVEGPDHGRTFAVAVRLFDRELGRGRGPSKKLAEEAAARAALAALEKQASPE
jgi:ribonuclease-3